MRGLRPAHFDSIRGWFELSPPYSSVMRGTAPRPLRFPTEIARHDNLKAAAGGVFAVPVRKPRSFRTTDDRRNHDEIFCA
jgi:hypothetical protein